MPDKLRVLVLCTGNSARSQMAEGILRHDWPERFDACSAGTKPTRVRPEAIQAMEEIGIDISAHRSKGMEEFLGQPFDYVITVCDNAKASCPTFPGVIQTFHWSIADPAAATGTEKERMTAFRTARDELRQVLRNFATHAKALRRPQGAA